MDAASSGDGCELWPKGVRKLVSSTHLDFLGDPIQMTKTTLLAAASAAVVLFAGAANAGVITGTVNGVPVNAAAEAYTIAKERVDAADATTGSTFVVTNTLSAKPTIAVGAPAQSFIVTFDITGGTVPLANPASLTVQQTATGGTAGSASVVQGARTLNSITFIVTVNAPTGAPATIDGFTLTTDVSNSAAEANIAVASTTQVSAGGVSSTIDTTAARTLVRYQNILASSLSSTSNTAKAVLPDFKLFTTAGITSNAAPLADTVTGGARTAELASDFKVAAGVTNVAGGQFRGGLTGAAVTAASVVDGGTLVVTGALPSYLTPALSTGGTLTRTATSASFALDNTQVDALITGSTDFLLSQENVAADRGVIPAGTYTAAFTPTFASGYTGSVAGSANAGTIVLDGTNFIAPWFSGSQAQTQSQVRLSNTGSAAATVRVSITNGVFNFNGSQTTFADATCGTGPFTLPVAGDLVLSSAVIKGCFGDFLRGDLLISVEAAGSGVTAKMRNTSANGTFETTLGRFSGAVASDASQ